jgi:hypothetical protein
MDTTDTIFFTHIPKTAGTSVRKAVITPHVSDDQILRPRGLTNLLADWSSFRFMRGHYPYGVHKLTTLRGTPRYFVMLREPVERALSSYHNAKRVYGPNYQHPVGADAQSHDVLDFYAIPKYQNMQARVVAGFLTHRIGEHVSLNWLKSLVHKRARHHLLHAYEAFGLTERYEESAQLFARKLGWTYQPNDKRYKQVPDRPTKDDLTSGQVRTLRRLNAIDVLLYETACEHFDEQLDV